MFDRKRLQRLRALVLALAGTCALGACVVTPVGPGRVYVGPAFAPPPPLAGEYVGVAPAPGYIWSGGYWGWAGGRYVWIGGRWLAPRPGFFWVRPHWVRGPGGWRFQGGHWRR